MHGDGKGRRVKILHINGNYIYSNLHQLMCNKLAELKIDNQVFVPAFKGAVANIDANKDVIVSECFNRNDRFFFYHKQNKITSSVQDKVDFDSIDIIHAHTLFTDGNCAFELSKKYDIPFIVAIRNTDINHFFKKRKLLKQRGIKIALQAKKIIFLSEAYKRWMFENVFPAYLHEEIEKKSFVIPNGIDDFWFDNIPKQKQEFDKKHIHLIYVGNIDKNKNIIKTQEAIDLLKENYDIKFTVIGPIKSQSEYKRVSSHKLTTCIEKQSKESLIDYYRNNDIFVMPSINETFGLVYAEAMSQGLPVIYSQGQGFDGQFEEGYIGYHVNSNSALDIADKIQRIINHYQELTDHMQEAVNKFKWDTICSNYKEIYENIISL